MNRISQTADEKHKVPAWIVSFTDMTTLLLAFFVLLQALATRPDPELFFQGQGSFRKALKNFGLPAWLLGRENRPAREYAQVKHTTDVARETIPRNDLLDGELERIQEAFQRLKRAIHTQSMDLADDPVHVWPTPIRFDPDRSDLNDAARKWLGRIALDLKASHSTGQRHVYVIGLASEARTPRQQWRLSALRARAVESALRAELAVDLAPGRWDIQSWGAGAGGQWCRSCGLESRQSHIALVVTEGSE
ncbi:MAG: OmpA family protein [Planctomycetota bacterium]|jgi:outer membrane protein OmpA-like peptidoglycan-associated protein